MATSTIPMENATKAGVTTISGLKNVSTIFTVTFDTPMANTNYSVSLLCGYGPYFPTVVLNLGDKTVNGFTFRALNSSTASDISAQTYNVDWIATPYR